MEQKKILGASKLMMILNLNEGCNLACLAIVKMMEKSTNEFWPFSLVANLPCALLLACLFSFLS